VEFAAWCQRNENKLPPMTDSEFQLMTYFTGRLPLFLNLFLAQSSFPSALLAAEAHEDVRGLLDLTQSSSKKFLNPNDQLTRADHIRFLRAVVSGSSASKKAPFEPRAFYLDRDAGSKATAVCGWVHDLASRLLLEHSSQVEVQLDGISRAVNISTLGFEVEHVVLQMLQRDGLRVATGLQADDNPIMSDWLKPHCNNNAAGAAVEYFDRGCESDLKLVSGIKIYLPRSWNYGQVDGVIRRAEQVGDSWTVLLVPFNVTIGSVSAHRDSIATFFGSQLHKWLKGATQWSVTWCWIAADNEFPEILLKRLVTQKATRQSQEQSVHFVEQIVRLSDLKDSKQLCAAVSKWYADHPKVTQKNSTAMMWFALFIL